MTQVELNQGEAKTLCIVGIGYFGEFSPLKSMCCIVCLISCFYTGLVRSYLNKYIFCRLSKGIVLLILPSVAIDSSTDVARERSDAARPVPNSPRFKNQDATAPRFNSLPLPKVILPSKIPHWLGEISIRIII
jgi:hypothetical protein